MNITRVQKNNNVHYVNCETNKIINDKETLQRINKMVIPPKWKNVKITSSPIDYLQVTGEDSKGRTQYIYHPLWKELTKTEKYSRLENFIKELPSLNVYINKVLNGPINLSSKVYIIVVIIKLLENTFSRIGNEIYSEENNTYGLTTILKKHIKIINDTITIEYIGKKGIKQIHEYKDSRCSTILKHLIQLPGERVFKTSNGEYINSIDINNFLKTTMNGNYTSKDFRTYATNKLLLKYLYKSNYPDDSVEANKTLLKCCNEVAEKLGHTRQVSKTNYIYPFILEEYNKNPIAFIKNKKDILSFF